jgi:hypothetical protein
MNMPQRARQHLRERGVWYAIGFATSMVVVLPGFYDELGRSWAFVMATLTVGVMGVVACFIILVLWMLVETRSGD